MPLSVSDAKTLRDIHHSLDKIAKALEHQNKITLDIYKQNKEEKN